MTKKRRSYLDAFGQLEREVEKGFFRHGSEKAVFRKFRRLSEDDKKRYAEPLYCVLLGLSEDARIISYLERYMDWQRAGKIRKTVAREYASSGGKAMRMKKYATACFFFDRAVEMMPENADYRCGFARALHNADQNEEAIQEMRKAIALKPRSGVLYKRIARLYKDSGEVDKAAESYARAAMAGHMPESMRDNMEDLCSAHSRFDVAMRYSAVLEGHAAMPEISDDEMEGMRKFLSEVKLFW